MGSYWFWICEAGGFLIMINKDTSIWGHHIIKNFLIAEFKIEIFLLLKMFCGYVLIHSYICGWVNHAGKRFNLVAYAMENMPLIKNFWRPYGNDISFWQTVRKINWAYRCATDPSSL